MKDSVGKHCIFVTSLGRTGTHFFGNRMMHMIEDCKSVHEPDVLYFDHMLPKKIKEFGLLRMTVGKISSKYSVRGLNIARLSGNISDGEIVKQISFLRENSLKYLKTSVYLEANSSWSSLVDLLPLSFPNARVVYIVRDPRTWIRSWIINAGPRYSFLDLRSWFKNARLTPFHFNGDPYQNRWKDMTTFEKLCWVWGKENSYAVECAKKTDSIRVFRFEDLFDEATNYKEMKELLRFTTNFPDGFQAKWTLRNEIVRQKTNSADGEIFPDWTEWGDDYVEIVNAHCGALMKRFNYGAEPEWQEKLVGK